MVRVSTRVHTRKLDRMVAHHMMKKAKMQKVNSHKYGNSFFSQHWRES